MALWPARAVLRTPSALLHCSCRLDGPLSPALPCLSLAGPLAQTPSPHKVLVASPQVRFPSLYHLTISPKFARAPINASPPLPFDCELILPSAAPAPSTMPATKKIKWKDLQIIVAETCFVIYPMAPARTPESSLMSPSSLKPSPSPSGTTCSSS